MGSRAGTTMALRAPRVAMSTHLAVSGLEVPAMMPGSSRNCLRTSSIISPAALLTARMAREAKKNTSTAPTSPPTKISGLPRSTCMTLTMVSPLTSATISKKAAKSRKAARAAEAMAYPLVPWRIPW